MRILNNNKLGLIYNTFNVKRVYGMPFECMYAIMNDSFNFYRYYHVRTIHNYFEWKISDTIFELFEKYVS